jgi:hypothetical protein
MRTRALVIGLGVACTTSLVGAAPSLAAKRCVGNGPGCYRTIQGALDASRDGDLIKVGAGSFAGGITVAKSVSITGAGAGATVIRGGGPVVTIGTVGAAVEPTVSIAGVKITGGRTSSSPATDFGAGGTAQARGGGVFVPPGADGGKGATVAIRDSVIAGNRAGPTTTLGPTNPDEAANWPACPNGPCPYAQADGGGIDNFGDMTLINVLVCDNEAGGPVASDATGAGIWSNLGTLTLLKSKVLHNRAAVVAPNGRFAEGGGILVQGGALTMRDTLIGDNATNITSTLPAFVGGSLLEMTSQAGGVLVAGQAPATIERTRFTGNESTAYDPVGEPAAYDSALLVLDGPLTLRDSVIRDNKVASVTQTTTDIGPAGTALEAHGGGTITNVQVVDNASFISAPAGDAVATGAVAVFNFDGAPKLLRFVDSVIGDNRAVAKSATGTATVQGAGIFSNSLLELQRTAVDGNVGKADAPTGAAEGGGIWNGVAVSGPPVELTLKDSRIVNNALIGGPGIERRGGGLFTTEPVTVVRTRISGNVPDQCFGCG